MFTTCAYAFDPMCLICPIHSYIACISKTKITKFWTNEHKTNEIHPNLVFFGILVSVFWPANFHLYVFVKNEWIKFIGQILFIHSTRKQHIFAGHFAQWFVLCSVVVDRKSANLTRNTILAISIESKVQCYSKNDFLL